MKSTPNPTVNFFFDKARKWKEEYLQLRTIILSCGLNEELKWGCPCYTLDKNNIVLIHGFKEYCALLFMKGALLKDPHQILIQQTANVQAARQIRFTHVKEIEKLKTVLKTYVQQAIAIEKAGLKVKLKKTAEYNIPKEFKAVLNNMADIKAAFYKLTPGRQRAYLLYFSSAKQSKTREERIIKSLQSILNGKGLND